ncbi:MAG: hypothetical protein ACI4DU_03815, partial [Lachnospiraceae bacterium]
MSMEKRLFISHAEEDGDMVEKFVDLLYDMGISKKYMFCSSISEIGIPNKEDIYEYLRKLLDSEQIIPIFMLSHNYYSSAACLNEMGAVWVKQQEYFTFLLPGFEFSQIKGAIDPRKRGISLGYESEKGLQNLKESLNQFREEMRHLFNLEDFGRWERKRDEFISTIQKIKIEKEVFDINLKECKGFCIGEYDEYRGCIVTFDKIKNKISAKIDFMETKAEICSVVIFVGEINAKDAYDNDKRLHFELKTSNEINFVEVECRLKNRDVCTKIETSSEWESYRIPLSEFGGAASDW